MIILRKNMTNKVCIIGAGISGLTTAKALLDKGIEFDLYEKESAFAGVWFYKEDTSQFSIYKSCHTIASKRFMTFADFPISDEYMVSLPKTLSGNSALTV